MYKKIIADKENVLKMLEWVYAELKEECEQHPKCSECPLVAICGKDICEIPIDNLIWLLKRKVK